MAPIFFSDSSGALARVTFLILNCPRRDGRRCSLPSTWGLSQLLFRIIPHYNPEISGAQNQALGNHFDKTSISSFISQNFRGVNS